MKDLEETTKASNHIRRELERRESKALGDLDVVRQDKELFADKLNHYDELADHDAVKRYREVKREIDAMTSSRWAERQNLEEAATHLDDAAAELRLMCGNDYFNRGELYDTTQAWLNIADRFDYLAGNLRFKRGDLAGLDGSRPFDAGDFDDD